MFFENWYYVMLRGIPETIAIALLAMALVGCSKSLIHIMLAGLGISVINFSLHQLPIQYGFHIPLSIIVFILVFVLLFKLGVLRSTAAIIFSFVLLILIEYFTMLVQIKVLGYPDDFIEHVADIERYLFSLPSLLLYLILAVGAQVWFRLRDRGDRGDVTRSA